MLFLIYYQEHQRGEGRRLKRPAGHRRRLCQYMTFF